jgi:class 3 adenylate cyclase
LPQALQVRIGLATGLAVVGDLIGSGAAQEQAVIGETPNLAARLQALAEPDATVIAETTRRLVGSLFDYQSLGEVEVKGLPTPVRAFRVFGESRVGSRLLVRGAALGREPTHRPRRRARTVAAQMGPGEIR